MIQNKPPPLLSLFTPHIINNYPESLYPFSFSPILLSCQSELALSKHLKTTNPFDLFTLNFYGTVCCFVLRQYHPKLLAKKEEEELRTFITIY